MPSGTLGVIDRTHMVVIGNAYGSKTCPGGECNDVFSGVRAIRKRCVEVEISLPYHSTERTDRDEVKERAMG